MQGVARRGKDGLNEKNISQIMYWCFDYVISGN